METFLPRPFAASALLAAAIFVVPSAPAHAASPRPTMAGADTILTRVTVRAVAHDAKVIGSGVGGARITIEDVATGRVLAEGVQEGTTGNTGLLVIEPRERGRLTYAADGAAGFTAVIPLAEPTRVRVTAEGPLGTPHATQQSSKTVLLVPGVDLTGDGIILELNGFTVRIEEPAGPAGAGSPIAVRAHVEMLCGCELEPGGLWDADRVRVVARLVRDGRVVSEQELEYAGSPSTFVGEIVPTAAGPAELQVLALDPSRGNTGIARSPVTIR